MPTWRLRDLVSEAVRNVGTSPVRSALFGVAAAVVVGSLVYAELTTTASLLAFEERFVESGGNMIVATSEEGLDVARCVSLDSQSSGIVGAAAVTSGAPVEIDQAPGTLFNTGTVTTGALRLFTVDKVPTTASVADRWIVGGAAAGELGIDVGMWLTVESSASRQVGVVIDTEIRNPQLQRWILNAGSPSGIADQCWVEFTSGARTGRQELVATTFADSTGLIVVPWTRLDEFSRDTIAELQSRPQANAWPFAGLLLATTVWLATWFRRSQIGLYRAVGSSPSALLILGAVESAIPLVVGSVSGAFWVIAVWIAASGGSPDMDQLRIAARTAGSVVLLAVLASPLLWPILARESIAKQLKDR